MTLPTIERKIRAGMPAIRFFQAYMPLPASRWLLKKSLSRARLAEGVTRQAVSAGGVPCEWIIPSNSARDQVLLYLHGGGFVYGLTPQHLEMVSDLAQQMGVRSLMVDYRLAPDFPYPAALDDCAAAYRWLLNQGFSPKNITLAGDSAGGNLVITTMMKLRDSGAGTGVPMLPAAAACLSPVGNLSDRGRAENGFRDPLLPPKAMRFYNTAYVARSDARNPLISPCLAIFAACRRCWFTPVKMKSCARMPFASKSWPGRPGLMCAWRSTRACGTCGSCTERSRRQSNHAMTSPGSSNRTWPHGLRKSA